MFEKLVESGARGNRGRTGKYFVGASLVYALGLLSIAISTVMWFNPGMAEAFELTSRLVPPIPYVHQPTVTAPRITSGGGGNPNTFIAPEPTLPLRRLQATPVLRVLVDDHQPPAGLQHATQLGNGGFNLHRVFERFGCIYRIERTRSER